MRRRIAGADPLAVRLLLTRLRILDNGIDIRGFLSQDDLTDLFRSSKALIAPAQLADTRVPLKELA